MKTYTAKKTDSKMTMVDNRWDFAECGALDCVWEDYYPSPYTTSFRMVHSEEGINVKISTDEWPLRTFYMYQGGEVCEDSCAEFFFTPNMTDEEYFNLEVTAVGTPLLGVGAGRAPRRVKLNVNGTGIEIETRILPERGWELLLFIPYSFMRRHFSGVGSVMRANFYKVGNLTARKHYSAWNKLEIPMPDFHHPEFFGKIILSEEKI